MLDACEKSEIQENSMTDSFATAPTQVCSSMYPCQAWRCLKSILVLFISQDFSRHNKRRYEVGFITCLKFECMKPWAWIPPRGSTISVYDWSYLVIGCKVAMVRFLRSDTVQEYATAPGSYMMWMQGSCLLSLFFLWQFPHRMITSFLWNSINEWSLFRLQHLAAEMDEMSTNVEAWASISMSKLVCPLRCVHIYQGYNVSICFWYVSICWLSPYMLVQGWKAMKLKGGIANNANSKSIWP